MKKKILSYLVMLSVVGVIFSVAAIYIVQTIVAEESMRKESLAALTSAAYMIHNNGQDLSLNADYLSETALRGGGYIFMLEKQTGTVLYHPSQSLVGTVFDITDIPDADEIQPDNALNNGIDSPDERVTIPESPPNGKEINIDGTAMLCYLKNVDDYTLISAYPVEAAYANRLLYSFIVFDVSALLFAIFCATVNMLITKNVISGIDQTRITLETFSDGELEVRAAASQTDEFVVISNVINQMIERIQEQVKTIRKLDLVDIQTGIANQNAVMNCLDNELRRAAREENVLSLMIVAVDFFERYIEKYGEEQGNFLLRELAKLFATNLKRPADMAARLDDGDAIFALLLPNTHKDGAMVVAEKIRAIVEDSVFVKPDDTEKPTAVTVSIGGYTIKPTHGVSNTLVIDTAKKKLDEAKLLGRNHIIWERF